MANDVKVKAVFLVEGDIYSWEKPLRPGFMRMPKMYLGSTGLIESLGMDTLDEAIEGYRIIASAAKYFAEISRVDKKRIESSPEGQAMERMVLFRGDISIYSTGEILGTKLQGYDLVSHGKIWAARKPVDLYSSSRGLHNLVFGEADDKKSRVEAIILGHEMIEEDKRNYQSQRDHSLFMNGKESGEAEALGYGL